MEIKQAGRKAPTDYKIRCALCNRWMPKDDRLGTPVGLVHFSCVAIYQAAKLTLTRKGN